MSGWIAPILAVSLLGSAPAPAPPAGRLTAANFEAVRAYARPTAEDRLYQSVGWRPTVADAIEDARRQDRPVIMWMYFGDPQGKC